MTSMMAPSIVLRDGDPRLVVGSAGSLRLRGAIMQIVIDVAVHGMSVSEAIDFPRFHLQDEDVHCEGGADPAELDRLEGLDEGLYERIDVVLAPNPHAPSAQTYLYARPHHGLSPVGDTWPVGPA